MSWYDLLYFGLGPDAGSLFQDVTKLKSEYPQLLEVHEAMDKVFQRMKVNLGK
jgi:hypothetical protein